MRKTIVNFLFVIYFGAALCLTADAQIADASTASGRPDPTRNQDLPEGILENLAKQRLKAQEKEYQELVKRGEEAALLGEQLNKSLEANQRLSSEDLKKIDRLEKVIKKIRSELGAKEDGDADDEETIQTPLTTDKAVRFIQKDSVSLLSEIKKIGRHSISVVAVESSNALLKMVRFLRFNKN